MSPKHHEGTSSSQPIIIPDDPQTSSLGREVEEIVQQIQVQQTGDARLNPIELLGEDTDGTDDGWAEVEADYDQEIQNIESIDLTLEEDGNDEEEEQEEEGEDEQVVSGGGVGKRKRTATRCGHSDKGARNPCLCGSHDQVDEHVSEQGKVKLLQVHGLTEEVRIGRFLVDFVEISAIWVPRATHSLQGPHGTVLVRGLAYTRTRNLDGRVPAYQNEVCQVRQVDTNDPRPEAEQAAVEVPLGLVHPQARLLLQTNRPFPDGRFAPADYRDRTDREARAPLVCRWQHALYYPDRRYRRAQRPVDGEVLRHWVEADIRRTRHRASDRARLAAWRRGPTIGGGSYVPGTLSHHHPHPHPHPHALSQRRVPGQKYTAADMFSGAGGVTQGAKKAGFQVLVAVDHWPRCNATYKANHPEVDLREVDIMDFCNDLTDQDDDDGDDGDDNGDNGDGAADKNKKMALDLIHLSPPCQTWSPAHTVTGRNDPANMAALSACQHLVHKYRPRLLTLEQTFGIIQERHLPYFNALVQSLTRYGYSLQWRVFPLVQFGLPQNRKRLLLVGAAPGEPLPPWPTPTHVEQEPTPSQQQQQQQQQAVSIQRPRHRRRPYVSAIKACHLLRDGSTPLHQVAAAKALTPPREPWDGTRPMNRTITTSGGQSYHWDGARELTLAEFARLQGFPYDYRFVGPCIKKQIGNAFPPCVVAVLMGHLRRHLEKLDGIVESEDGEDVDLICLEDDDDHDEDKDGAGRIQPFFSKREHQSVNWEAAQKEEEEIQEGDSKGALLFPPNGPNRPPSFEYLSGGLNAQDAWRVAIEESKRDDRRRSTADSSVVVVTCTKKLVIEVDDNDEPEPEPESKPKSTGLPRRPSPPFRRPLSLVCQQQQQRHTINPSLLTPRTSSSSSSSNMAGPPSSFSSASPLPLPLPLPHHRHPQSPPLQDSGAFFETEGYVQVFPRASPSLSAVAGPNNTNSSNSSNSSSSSRRTPSHSHSGNGNGSKAPAAAARNKQLDPTNYRQQIQDAFRHNGGMRSIWDPSSIASSSASASHPSTRYQGGLSEDEALDAALRASMLQLQKQQQQKQQQQQVQVQVQVSVPMPMPLPVPFKEQKKKEKEEEEEEEEEDPIAAAAIAAAAQFFGPWNPPVSQQEEEEEEEEEEEGEFLVRKGKGKAKAKAVSRKQDKDKDDNTAAAADTAPLLTQAVDDDGDVEMDEDAVLQMAIAMSMEGVPPPPQEEEEEEEDRDDTKRSYEGDEGGSPSKKGRPSD